MSKRTAPKATDDLTSYNRDAKRRQRERAIAAGLCGICCSKPPEREGRRTCDECIAKSNASTTARRARAPKVERVVIKVPKFCSICGSQTPQPRRGLCANCYAKSMRLAKKSGVKP